MHVQVKAVPIVKATTVFRILVNLIPKFSIIYRQVVAEPNAMLL